jgi:hypothetical protein
MGPISRLGPPAELRLGDPATTGFRGARQATNALVSATPEAVVDWIAPTVQRYLTGKLDR